MSLSAVRVSAKVAKPTAAVIFSHGLGDSGQGWKFLADVAQRSPDFNHIMWVFPNAPSIPISVNNGYRMPGWFDILSLGADNETQDGPGFLRAIHQVDKYIKEVTECGIPTERILIGGFSQGGGLALGKLADSKEKYAGFLVLSPFVTPFLPLLKDLNTEFNKDTPVFHGQGDADDIVPKRQSDISSKYFQEELGYKDYTYKTYPGVAHSVGDDELVHALEFIKAKVPVQ